MVTRRYLVSGRVQGVGFRWFVKRSADRHGIRGWVRNRADGRVETEATGMERALEAFEDDLRRGPDHARVDDVDVRAVSAESAAAAFDILADE